MSVRVPWTLITYLVGVLVGGALGSIIVLTAEGRTINEATFGLLLPFAAAGLFFGLFIAADKGQES